MISNINNLTRINVINANLYYVLKLFVAKTEWKHHMILLDNIHYALKTHPKRYRIEYNKYLRIFLMELFHITISNS